MKKPLLILVLFLLQIITYAQNPIWSVAPDYLKMNDLFPVIASLPQPTPPSVLSPDEQEFYYYHGQSATAASNAQADASCFKL